jgi:hypothetical protein
MFALEHSHALPLERTNTGGDPVDAASWGPPAPLLLPARPALTARSSRGEVLWRRGPTYGGEPREKVGAAACRPKMVLDVPVTPLRITLLYR